MLTDAEKMSVSWFRLLRGYTRLFFLEFRLAKRSVIPFFMMLGFFIIFCMVAWASVTAFGAYGLYLLTHDIFISLLIMMGVNLFILLVFYLSALKYHRQMRFLKIRKRIRSHAASLKKIESRAV